MSTRTRILLAVLVLVVASIATQYLIPQTQIPQPHVSVAAEPVIAIDGGGVHLGHGAAGALIINNSMIMALIVTIFLIVLAALTTRSMRAVPRGLQNFMEMVIDLLYNTFAAVDRKYIARFFPLVGAVFLYVLASNWLALIPGVLTIGYYENEEGESRLVLPKLLAWAEPVGAADATAALAPRQEPAPSAAPGEGTETHGAEGPGEEGGTGHGILVPFLRSPSADLNNTFMLAIVAFFFTQFWGVRELGGSYFYKFFPFREGPVGIFTGLVEIISELARVVSFAFRLFGNVFAGEVILLVMVFLLPALQFPFLGLEVFIGFIQAFVFAILIMVFTSLATQAHGDHGGEHGHHGEEVPADLGGHTRANPVH